MDANIFHLIWRTKIKTFHHIFHRNEKYLATIDEKWFCKCIINEIIQISHVDWWKCTWYERRHALLAIDLRFFVNGFCSEFFKLILIGVIFKVWEISAPTICRGKNKMINGYHTMDSTIVAMLPIVYDRNNDFGESLAKGSI